MRKSPSGSALRNVLLSITSILCVFAMGCYHRPNAAKSSPVSVSPSPSMPPVTAPVDSVPQGETKPIPVPLPPDTEMVDDVLIRLQDCPGLKPICQPGGLLKQSAGVDEINAYQAKYKPDTATCRWMQPPRCYTKQKRACKQECTP